MIAGITFGLVQVNISEPVSDVYANYFPLSEPTEFLQSRSALLGGQDAIH